MKIITGYEELPRDSRCAVAIGKFDGIHIGHQKLLSEILSQREKQLISCVFTFDPPPEVLFGKSDGRELMTREEKRRVFAQMGVDLLVEFPLTRESAAMEPEDFVRKILCGNLHCGFVAAGRDVSFGKGGRGNEELLRSLAPELDFTVKTIDKVCIGEQEVGSTYIRQLVREGRMEECEAFLGRPYSIVGQVVHGNHIGTSIGAPTANLQVQEHKLLPPYGVYFSSVYADGQWVANGISNIGVKPTIAADNPQGVETCLFDFAGDLYGKELEICFAHFHRSEQQFADVAQLQAQIQQDIAACERFWCNQK